MDYVHTDGFKYVLQLYGMLYVWVYRTPMNAKFRAFCAQAHISYAFRDEYSFVRARARTKRNICIHIWELCCVHSRSMLLLRPGECAASIHTHPVTVISHMHMHNRRNDLFAQIVVKSFMKWSGQPEILATAVPSNSVPSVRPTADSFVCATQRTPAHT